MLTLEFIRGLPSTHGEIATIRFTPITVITTTGTGITAYVRTTGYIVTTSICVRHTASMFMPMESEARTIVVDSIINS
jgi:hypothetical protein